MNGAANRDPRQFENPGVDIDRATPVGIVSAGVRTAALCAVSRGLRPGQSQERILEFTKLASASEEKSAPPATAGSTTF